MRLLDLFCCAGGAAQGYFLGGFDEIVGVDIEPQKHYPFEFVLDNALEYLKKHGKEFDFIHASPPCQAWSFASAPHKVLGKEYPELIVPVRKLLVKTGVPYVIENVVGAPLLKPVLLCGAMFGLKTYRHRLFETSFVLVPPVHPAHMHKVSKMGRPANEGGYITLAGHFSGVPYAQKVMECPWMNQYELAQAIPPAYTCFIAKRWFSMYNVKELKNEVKGRKYARKD